MIRLRRTSIQRQSTRSTRCRAHLVALSRAHEVEVACHLARSALNTAFNAHVQCNEEQAAKHPYREDIMIRLLETNREWRER